MAASMAAVSRRLHLSLRPAAKSINLSVSFCSSTSSGEASDPGVGSDADITSDLPQSPEPSPKDMQGAFFERELENGLDPGVYKAIIVGQVGQTPLQKKLRSGRSITMFSVGTGGIRNNRRPLQNEDPREYANRCAVQWHRVSVYPESLGNMSMKNIVPGSILYLEGNLETKIFTEPVTGLVRRIREIAIRRNGRIVFLGNESSNLPSQSELKNVGYY